MQSEMKKSEMQTVWMLMRRLIMSRLIWIHTVCKIFCIGLTVYRARVVNAVYAVKISVKVNNNILEYFHFLRK